VIREVARADPRSGHFGKVTSGKPPNPLDSHISATSNSLSFSPRLPELADQANRRMHLLRCQLPLLPAAIDTRSQRQVWLEGSNQLLLVLQDRRKRPVFLLDDVVPLGL